MSTKKEHGAFSTALHLPLRKISKGSLAWVPSPRNVESPRNNLEAADDSGQIDRHVQNLSALMADLSPREPTPLDVELRIESLEGMLNDVAVLVESFIGNEGVTRRLLEMHGRIEQCIALHKLLQSDFSAAASSIAEEEREVAPKSASSTISRKKKGRHRGKKDALGSSIELLQPQALKASHGIVDAANQRRKTRTDSSRARLNSPFQRDSSEELISDHSWPVAGSWKPRKRSTPPLVPPEDGRERLSAVVRMVSPPLEYDEMIAELVRKHSSETETTETESLSSEEDRHSVMEKIRARLMDMAHAQRGSSKPKEEADEQSMSVPWRPLSPLAPACGTNMDLCRVKSDSVLASSVEIRAKLDELLETLRSPDSSPRGGLVRPMLSPGRGAPLRSDSRGRGRRGSARRITSASVPSSPRRGIDDLITVNCRICWESVPLLLCHQIEECGDAYCAQCLHMYCTTKIDEGQVLVINCPEPTCTAELTPNDLIRLVDQATFRRYQQFHLLATLHINPNCRWCPRPGCNTGVIASPEEPKLECTSCGTEICFACKSFWHGGTECADTTHDERFAAFMKEMDAKQCPSCQNFIERNKGCNVMKCSICAHKFCWLCLQAFTVDHFDRDGPCKGKWGVSRTEMALVYTLAGGMLVASAAVAIPSMVLGAPIYGTYRVGKWVRKGRRRDKKKKKKRAKEQGSASDRRKGLSMSEDESLHEPM